MKRVFIALLLAVLSTKSFADSKISALTLDSAPDRTNLTIEVDDPSGTPTSKSVTFGSVSDLSGFSLTGTNVGLTNSNNNTGLGNSSPAYKLDVTGTVRATAFIGDGSALTGISAISGLTTNTVPKATSSTAIGNSQITDNGTNVGINQGSPTQKLEVNGTVKATNFSGLASGLTSIPANQISGIIPIANLASGTPDGTKFIRDDGTLVAPSSGGTVSSGTADRVAIYDAAGTTVTSSSVITDDNTNIGISNTSPSAKLDVTGTTKTTTLFTTGNVGIATATAGNVLIVQGSGQTSISGANIQVTPTVGSTRIFQGSGNTITTGRGLDLTMDGLTTGFGIAFNSACTGCTQDGFAFNVAHGGSNAVVNGAVARIASTGALSVGPVLKVEHKASDTTPFSVAKSGNVGIGTFVPMGQLDIRFQTPAPPLLIGNSATDATGAFLKMDTNGNVGIGSVSPGAGLDVAGSFRSVAGAAVGVGACWCTTPPKVLGYCSGALGTCSACNYNGAGC